MPPALQARVLNAPVSFSSAVSQRALPAPGERGKAVTLLRPVGRVRFGDRVLEATAANGYVEAGSEVVVESAEGDKLTVSAVEKEDE